MNPTQGSDFWRVADNTHITGLYGSCVLDEFSVWRHSIAAVFIVETYKFMSCIKNQNKFIL